MQYGPPSLPPGALAHKLPRQVQQGQLRPLPSRPDQAWHMGSVPPTAMERAGGDSFARLRSQSPRQIDEAVRIQQQQASSSEDF